VNSSKEVKIARTAREGERERKKGEKDRKSLS
jgi:hypothetical protein